MDKEKIREQELMGEFSKIVDSIDEHYVNENDVNESLRLRKKPIDTRIIKDFIVGGGEIEAQKIVRNISKKEKYGNIRRLKKVLMNIGIINKWKVKREEEKRCLKAVIKKNPWMYCEENKTNMDYRLGNGKDEAQKIMRDLSKRRNYTDSVTRADKHASQYILDNSNNFKWYQRVLIKLKIIKIKPVMSNGIAIEPNKKHRWVI